MQTGSKSSSKTKQFPADQKKLTAALPPGWTPLLLHPTAPPPPPPAAGWGPGCGGLQGRAGSFVGRPAEDGGAGGTAGGSGQDSYEHTRG